MLSGITLIVVTMFAVLGAYYLSDLLTSCLFKSKRVRCVAILPAETPEQVWNGVLDLRARMPQSTVVVLSGKVGIASEAREPSMQDVVFATPETLCEVVCGQLSMTIPK